MTALRLNEARIALHEFAAAMGNMTRGLAETRHTEAMESTAPHIEIAITPNLSGAAPISIMFDFNEGFLRARLGRHATSCEWIESREELEVAVQHIVTLSKAVISEGFVERSTYTGGALVRSMAVLRYDGAKRKIVDGRPSSFIKALFRRRHTIETVYLPYNAQV